MSHPIRGPRTLALLALLVVLCAACFASAASALDTGTSGPRSAVTPAIRKAAASPVASGRPGYWAQASCSYKEELAYENEDWSLMTDGAYNITNGESGLDTCLLVGGGITARHRASPVGYMVRPRRAFENGVLPDRVRDVLSAGVA
jgi:hypothetical protein